ncbi:hypothetical protein HMSSN036_62460 [Paenibacillus macerans]|nr:hypothetical protein HMSSN036_62460 [Paenibacillus macerans]
MDYFHVFTGGGQWLIAIVVLSTLLTMILAGAVAQAAGRITAKTRRRLHA